jgi:hypothetical protein
MASCWILAQTIVGINHLWMQRDDPRMPLWWVCNAFSFLFFLGNLVELWWVCNAFSFLSLRLSILYLVIDNKAMSSKELVIKLGEGMGVSDHIEPVSVEEGIYSSEVVMVYF